MKDPDRLWMDIAHRFAEQSRCQTRKVGCVIVSADEHMIGQGWNGAPSGSECSSCPRCSVPVEQRSSGQNLDLAVCTHAEANAIGYAARAGIPTRDAIMYVTVSPCAECAKLIVASGIRKVVYHSDYETNHNNLCGRIFSGAGVQLVHYDAGEESS